MVRFEKMILANRGCVLLRKVNCHLAMTNADKKMQENHRKQLETTL